MSYLLDSTKNKVLDLIRRCAGEDKMLPTETALAKEFSVSRTTIRSVLEQLLTGGVLLAGERGRSIARLPVESDYASINEEDSKTDLFEKYFLKLIQSGKIQPGERFSELSLAKQSGCNTNTVREYLIRFSKTGLIRKTPRAHWQMVEFNRDFADELIAFRKILEVASVTALLKRPESDSVWNSLEQLLIAHRNLLSNIEQRYDDFPELDSKLHSLLQNCSGNRFIEQFFEIVKFICHYHYQWDKSDEKERNRLAVKEHIDLIENLLARDIHGSIVSLERHLDTAHTTLLKSVYGLGKQS